MKVLAVIPARGGSKGIPKKNIRLMNNKPLIYYAINNGKTCLDISDVVVTSDDDEILDIAKGYGADIIKREAHLSDDKTTLAPVVFDATNKMEERKGYKYDIVITLQPTSPLLSVDTLSKALSDFSNKGHDTTISVYNTPHLAWSKKGEEYFPLYDKRLNRQQLPPHYMETGAFVITKREFITESDRFGKIIYAYEVPEKEAVDIDTVNDWIVCEKQLSRKKVVLRADGHKKLGMGHIYHCITIAYKLIDHDVFFVTREDCREGLEKIKSTFFPYKTISCDEDYFDFLKEYRPDIVVNDCLDTTADYIKELKKYAGRVVTIEDLGDGINYADAVINALYKEYAYAPNVFCGAKYVCLRDEFMLTTPIEIRDEVKNVLVVFGGTDPSNLTEKVYQLALEITSEHKGIDFTFLTALSYDCNEHGVIPTDNIHVVKHAKRVSKFMEQADIAFTSQGRTIHELASMGVPSIVLAQNEREMLHTFAHIENGFLNLGLGSEIEYKTIKNAFYLIAGLPELRKNMHNLMLKHDLKSGIDRVKNIILGE